MSAGTLKIKPLHLKEVFPGVDETGLRTMAEAFELVELPAGRVLGRTGRTSKREQDTVWLLLAGQVAAQTAPATKQQVAVNRTLGPGELVGMISFLRGGPRTATTQTLSPVKAGMLTRANYEKFIRPEPALNSALLLVLAQQLARDVRQCNERLTRAVQKTGQTQMLKRSGGSKSAR